MPPDAIHSPIPRPPSSSAQSKKHGDANSPIPTPRLNVTPSIGHVPTPPPSFMPYELDDEATLRPSTPELIKVTKVKKSSGKKKKTREVAVDSAGTGSGDVR